MARLSQFGFADRHIDNAFLFLSQLKIATLLTEAGASATYQLGDARFQFTGTGFTYATIGGKRYLTGGTIDSIRMTNADPARPGSTSTRFSLPERTSIRRCAPTKPARTSRHWKTCSRT